MTRNKKIIEATSSFKRKLSPDYDYVDGINSNRMLDIYKIYYNKNNSLLLHKPNLNINNSNLILYPLLDHGISSGKNSPIKNK